MWLHLKAEILSLGSSVIEALPGAVGFPEFKTWGRAEGLYYSRKMCSNLS